MFNLSLLHNEFTDIERQRNEREVLNSFITGHPAATYQKVLALRERKETQPRDVFDLDFLFGKFPDAVSRGTIETSILQGAFERAFEISYEEYRSKVVTFLDPDVRDAYRQPDVWAQIQERVLDQIEALMS